jgi:hypothetical protein
MSTDHSTRVIVTDIKMPFWSMVRFMVKWAIAAIPALIILTIIGALLSAAVTGFFVHANGKMVDARALHALVVTTV